MLAVLLNESAIAISLAIIPLAFIDASVLIDEPSDTMWLLSTTQLTNVLASREQVLPTFYGPVHVLFLAKQILLIQVKVRVRSDFRVRKVGRTAPPPQLSTTTRCNESKR